MVWLEIVLEVSGVVGPEFGGSPHLRLVSWLR